MPEGPKRLHGATILVVAIEQAKSLVGLLLVFVIARSFGDRKTDIGLDLIFAGIGLLTFIPALIKYFSVRYQLSDDAFTVTSGVLFRQKRIVPLERIQNVSLKRNLLHQALGVTALSIETASGAGAEVELSVISVGEADRLTLALQNLQPAEVTAPTEKAIFEASFGDLLLAGATQNKAGVILLFFLGLMNYVQDLIPRVIKTLPGFAHVAATLSAQALTLASLAVVLLLFAGWLLSIITTLLLYFGFRLTRNEGVLKLKHGLLTQIQATLPVRRIQSIRVVSPIVQRRLGYCNVFADSAASYADKQAGGAAMLTPLIEYRRIDEVVHLAFPSLIPENAEWRQVSPLLKRRSFVRYLLISIIFVGASEYFLGPIAFAALPATAAAAWFFAWKRHQILGYCQLNGCVLVRDGVWKRTISILPEDRIQWIGLEQSPFQRRLGISSLSLVSAAAGGRPIIIEDLVHLEATTLQNNLGKKVHIATELSGGL